MNTKIYVDNEKIIAGMTLKNVKLLENNNMALHACVDAEQVLQNRATLATTLDCELGDFVCSNQTHSANFHKVILADKGRGAFELASAIPDTDALYTVEPNLVLGSFTADCVPVFFYHEARGLIGVIHSGWQGTVKEITPKLFGHLRANEQCEPGDFHIQIGAALSQEKFEVDEDVYVKFKALGYADDFIDFNEETGKYHIDNQKVVQRQIERAGIPSNQITVDRTCTFMSPDGFSYRKDKQCGRHLNFIMKKSF